MTHFYHLIIIDASGSMHAIYRKALSGCNESLQQIRHIASTAPDQEHFVSLVSFNSADRCNLIYDAIPAAETADLTERDYITDGCTPLYDCVGLSISHLQATIKARQRRPGMPVQEGVSALADPKPLPEVETLVTIITDGEENSSTLFDARKLKSLIEECKQQGWTFAYIGANQDDMLEAEKMGIRNHMSFDCTDEGVDGMFSAVSEARYSFCFEPEHRSAYFREKGFFKKKE